VQGDSDPAHSRNDHPHPGLIAAYADGRLTGSEAARVEEHLADCSECYEVFAETVAFTQEEEKEEPVSRKPTPVVPPARRRVSTLLVGLAVAASLLVAVGWLATRTLGTRRSGSASLVAELAQAMGTTRFVEPRLTGGFQHGRFVVLRSGDAPQGLDAQSPAVLAAVAHIRERAAGDTSPEALGALAVTYLVSGDVAGAVKALESATAQDSKNAKLQSDLAAAYLVRASRLDEPSDIPRALEAAEKSVELKDAPVEAWFNRALALEALHLVDAARKAWDDYLQRDPTSPWAEEARKRKAELPPAQQSTLEEDRARAKAALAEGKTSVDRLADESPSILRDYFDNVLLYAWADAYLAGLPTVATLQEQAQLAGEALLRTTGDEMPRDAARALSARPSGASRDPPAHTQALGYKALQSAQDLYDKLRFTTSCTRFRKAQSLLQSANSPYAVWGQQRAVAACFYSPVRPDPGLAELRRLEPVAEQRHYGLVLGRVRHMQGLFLAHRGELSLAIDRYRIALDSFREVKDAESEAKLRGMIAEALGTAGDARLAWREYLVSLSLLDRVRDVSRRYAILAVTSRSCRDLGLVRTSIQLETALVETAAQWSPTLTSSALASRSLAWHALGAYDAATTDLAEARGLIPSERDTSLAEGLSATVDAAEGEILGRRQPERAANSLERAIQYFERTTPVYVPGLRLLLARAQLERGHDDAAEAELTAGIRLLESQRISFKQAALQASFFDTAVPLFDDMVGLQIDRRHDPQRALTFVERGRARQLVDSLRSPRTQRASGSGPVADAETPLGPEALQRGIPEGSALVYYVVSPTRLLSWVVTHGDVRFLERSLLADDLQRAVAAYQTAMERRAPIPFVREHAARLFDELVRPLGSWLQAQQVLVVVPDAVLHSVSFASLWDRQSGRYLAEDHLVASAPSGTVFVRASAAAAREAPLAAPHLLAVGNPRLDREQSRGLPSLAGAEAEATEIAALYQGSELLTGRAATKAAFLASARGSEIVHFAGHATLADGFGSSQLLLAPDPQAGASGMLEMAEIGRKDFPRTRVVVLAGCRTASGSVSQLEGAMGLARPFLAAGVPNVIASLWDVDDAVSRRFFVEFHRALLSDHDPALALRQAQAAFLRNADPALSHPASWAGFACIGGLNPRSLPRLAATVTPRQPS
jgi:CHAT domain-containing protein